MNGARTQDDLAHAATDLAIIDQLTARGIIDPSVPLALRELLSNGAVALILNGRMAGHLGSAIYSYLIVPPAAHIDNAVERRLFQNTLALMIDDGTHAPPSALAQSRLFEYLRKHPESSSEALDAIKTVRWTKSSLVGALTELYPEFARQQLNQIVTQIKVSASSLLLREDLKQLLSRSDKIVLADADASINIDIKEVEVDFVNGGEQRERMIYNQSQVNVFDRVMSMPRNSTYQFDYTKGSDALSYAYALSFSVNGTTIKEELFRGAATYPWGVCGAPVIVNVFGGTSAAGFVANGQMQELCTSSRARVVRSDAKAQVLSRLSQKLLEMLEPIKSHNLDNRQ